MQTLVYDILGGLFIFIPALVANPGAVITGGHGKLDRGKNFIDGRRILGDGKSVSGYFGGIAIGAVSGIIVIEMLNIFKFAISSLSFITVILVSTSLSWGSLTGDLLGSFIKRRLNMNSGARGSLLDMWPFVLVAFMFLYLIEPKFFINVYGNFIDIAFIMVLVPLLHRGVNILAYKMHRKDVPW